MKCGKSSKTKKSRSASGSLGTVPGCRAASSATIRGEAEPTWWTCSSALGRPAMKSITGSSCQPRELALGPTETPGRCRLLGQPAQGQQQGFGQHGAEHHVPHRPSVGGSPRVADNEAVALTLTQLNRFPVKSCRGEQLETAVVEPWGLAGDRRWMLVDPAGETVTAREHQPLLLVTPRLRPDGGLEVTAADRPPLSVARPVGNEHVTVTIFRRTPFAAAPADDGAHSWFSELLGKPVRLVYGDDPHRRPASEDFAGPGVPLAFGDGYPVLLATEASLAALNQAIADGPRAAEGPLAMVRFRPNLVVSGGEAWAEDGWRRLRIGDAVFRAVKGCDRCVIAATDAETALRGKEPTATLARHRRWDGAVWFGMNLVPETPGAVLTVGDEVELLETVPAPDGPPR